MNVCFERGGCWGGGEQEAVCYFCLLSSFKKPREEEKRTVHVQGKYSLCHPIQIPHQLKGIVRCIS